LQKQVWLDCPAAFTIMHTIDLTVTWWTLLAAHCV